MTGNRWKIAALAALSGSFHARFAVAEDQACMRVTRANVASCALTASLSAAAERQTLEAARAHEEAAAPVLPSNPVLSGWIGRRTAPGAGSDTNWNANLAQEIEIGGQRGARRRTAAFERVAQTEAVRLAERGAVAEAWRAYFEALAARQELSVVERLEETFRRVATGARAAEARGLSAGVDADVADAAFVRIEARRVEAERRVGSTNARLAAELGLDPTRNMSVEGALEPLALPLPSPGLVAANRPEVRALQAEANAEQARADGFRRARIPSPTISAFVERDQFSEHLFGVGLALPIPLPHPLGRTYAGEIDEAEALARAARTRAMRVEREIGRDVATARAAHAAAQNAVALYADERMTRAEKTLGSIGSEIEAGRIGIRDAVVAQETLVEMLLASVEARRALATSSVDVAVAMGVALEGGGR